ncbi:zinc finger BED domain-containing protein RICESLEEPER 1-like [Panicum miliaceum]|uniref:Zinc finger BED domain-containing protein RICESLEEPER 1-like n=1 Tax=Panicum miliaceum TaxID=4540 RepID=A0A3L6RHY3_PANMI|nr:zinc finger BED domain-containing protein RICESLEEPER 1-like [Panicum miliaceum]
MAWEWDKCKPRFVNGVIQRPSTEVWKDFIPLYADGRKQIMAAECVNCNVRLNANRRTMYLNRHIQTCPARGRSRTSINQDELSPVFTNVEVQFSEYGSKFLKCSSGDRTPVDRCVSASPAQKRMNPKKDRNMSSAQTLHSMSRKFDQEASFQELSKMIILHGHPLSIVEHEEMRSFSKSLNPEFNMASSIDVEEYSTILFQKLKADLHQKIAQSHRVSLSASLCTPHGSESSVKYLCLSVHFVDSDWKLQRRIIKFGVFCSSTTNLDRLIHLKEAPVLDSETGPFILISEAIRDWNLDQKLLSLTTVVMDHLDDHESDDMEAAVPSDGDSRFRNKKSSKIWDMYKPVTVNGGIHGMECRYCHANFSYKSGHLWRHHKSCTAKEALGPSEQQQNADLRFVLVNETDPHPLDRIPPDSLDDIDLVSQTHSESKTLVSEVETSVSNHKARKRKNNSANPSSNSQRSQEEPTVSFQSSVRTSKSRLQDEVSLANGKASKFHKRSSGDRTPVDQDILASQQRDKMDPTEQNTSTAQATPDVNTKFDQESSYQELTRMIILHGYPLSIVEHEETRCFVKSLNPGFNMASSTDIEEFSIILFQERKADLKRKIALSSHRVSLSACLWTPRGSEASVKYLCLAVHFIDSGWKIEKRIIKFGIFRSSHTNLDRMIHFNEDCALDSESGPFNVMWEAIRDWNLDQKLLSLTSVGEIRDDVRTSELKDFLIQRKCLPVGGELYNAACLDDVLNGVVSKGQPMLNLAGDILERFIQAHMSSPLAKKQLIEVTNMKLKCLGEDAKWWHKIYFGLEVLLDFKKAFPSEELLPAEDTKTVESVCKILRAFYHAVEVISGTVCPTANMYFNELWMVRATLEEQAATDYTELSSMVWEMQKAFDEFWQNSYVWLSVPVVFYPRFKIAFIEFRLKRAFGSKIRSQVSTELTNYLDDGLVPRDDDFDILNWWMSNATKYPILSVMARDILAMPGSAVQCEAPLSSEGPVISKQWSKLNIKTIEALVCIQDWIK